jgi:hypothetical protein
VSCNFLKIKPLCHSIFQGLTSAYCYEVAVSVENKYYEHMKWETGNGQQNSEQLCKLQKRLVTEYIPLRWDVFLQQDTSGTSTVKFSPNNLW